MKGQIFLVTAIVLLLALYMIRTSTKVAEVKKSEVFYDSFSNLRHELVRTIDLAILNGDSVSDRLNDFISLSEDVYARKGFEQSINYTVYNGQTTTVLINVSLSSSDSYLMEELIISRTVYT